MQYLKLFSVLNKNQVDYLLCGGLAVNIYGIPRMTADIDIIIKFEEKNLLQFENSVKTLMLQQMLPISIKTFVKKEDRDKIKLDKNLIAYSYFSPQMGHLHLDVLLDVPLEFDTLWRSKSIRQFQDVNIPIVSVEHLIELKKYANRLQDQNDVILLSKLLKK
jgi:hypothetical protein